MEDEGKCFVTEEPNADDKTLPVITYRGDRTTSESANTSPKNPLYKAAGSVAVALNNLVQTVNTSLPAENPKKTTDRNEVFTVDSMSSNLTQVDKKNFEINPKNKWVKPEQKILNIGRLLYQKIWGVLVELFACCFGCCESKSYECISSNR